MIVVDTLSSRAMAGADENGSQDASLSSLRTVTILRKVSGAHLMVVHHSGKDKSRGAEGI